MKRFALIVAATVAAGLPVAAPADGSAAPMSRACSKHIQPNQVTRLRVTASSCATAARIARGWARRAGCNPAVPFIDRRCTVSGWRCRASRVAIVTTRTVGCSRRSSRVHFLHRAE